MRGRKFLCQTEARTGALGKVSDTLRSPAEHVAVHLHVFLAATTGLLPGIMNTHEFEMQSLERKEAA